MGENWMTNDVRVLMTRVRHTFVFQRQFPLVDPAKFFGALRAKGFAYQMQPGMELDEKSGVMRNINIGIARRDTGSVIYDPEKGYLSVTNEATVGLLPSQVEGEEEPGENEAKAHALNSALEDLVQVHDILSKQLEVIMSKSVGYTECIVEALLAGRKLPLVALNQRLSVPILNEISALQGEDVAVFNLRLFSKAHLYNEMNIKKLNNWYELRVEPMITNPKQYYLNAVFRNENYEVYLNFVRGLERLIVGVIRTLEKD